MEETRVLAAGAGRAAGRHRAPLAASRLLDHSASRLHSPATTFVLKTHVCLGAQPGWKGHRHSIAPGDSAPRARGSHRFAGGPSARAPRPGRADLPSLALGLLETSLTELRPRGL